MKNSKLWMSRETGELLTYEEAWDQGVELYDLDETNVVAFEEYYEITDLDVPDDWDEWRGGSVDWGDEPDDIDSDMGYDPYEGCLTWDC